MDGVIDYGVLGWSFFWTIVVTVCAVKLKHSGILYFLVCAFLSPLVGAIILAIHHNIFSKK